MLRRVRKYENIIPHISYTHRKPARPPTYGPEAGYIDAGSVRLLRVTVR